MDVRTTEELVQILWDEMNALNRGEKGLPMELDTATAKEIEQTAGILGEILGAERMAQVAYFCDIKEQVREYQQEYNVSGLLIQEFEIEGNIIRFPRPHDWLIMVEADYDVMRTARDRVVDFFAEYVKNNFVYLSHTISSQQGFEWDMETTLDFILQFASEMEWAVIFKSNPSDYLISLELGYGDYSQAGFERVKDSEVWYFNASTSCCLGSTKNDCNA